MVGSSSDILARLVAVLPAGWFADSSPVLDGLLSGLADAGSRTYSLIGCVTTQARLRTVSGNLLDLAAKDYFGGRLARRSGEADAAFRARLLRTLLRERATRSALVTALTNLTGRAPTIFEPSRTTDTGGYRLGGVGFGRAGGYGSLALPFQCFVTAYRPVGSGIASIGGYGTGGPRTYASLAMVQGQVTDSDIYAAVANSLPTATIAWTRITN